MRISSLWFAVASAGVPTAPQLEYQQHEIMALVHFNMATFAKNGDPGCSADNWDTKQAYAAGKTNDPATFSPAKLDTDQWAQSMMDVGAKHAVLTAKHGCGFALWPSKVKLPSGDTYGYSVGSPGALGRDVLQEFSGSMEKAGIGHGFYYSLTNNFYLNVHVHSVQPGPTLPGQVKVSQDQFEQIALAQVSELWTNYGNLTEIWFDGGYTSDMKQKITALLAARQPNAAAFGGFGVSHNPVCWVGTESGNPGGDIWSSGASDGTGDPLSSDFCPKGCDTTLQEGDVWFFEEGNAIRSLKELIDVYHATVGRNGVLELDFAINRDGLVDPAHAARYKDLGDWVKSCYGTPVATAHGSGKAPVVTTLASASIVDRVMIQEEFSAGHRIKSFTVEYQASPQGAWQPFGAGGAVGNKRILVGDAPVSAVALRVLVTGTIGADAATISNFSVFKPCIDSGTVLV
eukprot:CAMPEP_0204274080 /NCGR_PEP_ID=MMETSP0468-20130131/24976_1 /ASSEMBLY_ACC=CAM_ASM_000383 /TAXON_ID=2969 /ORGANISM="Oxyrrhis marina" /LENGTH=458 /DNA_ID=CAMNT_0051250231 /DNA_START=32 /DNA_END=1408 /DNA_ORIENTATION=+